MKVRTIATQVVVGAAVLGGVLIASAVPAAASVGVSVVDAAGVYRGGGTADSYLVTVCDRSADGVTVSVEFRFADGVVNKRTAPLGGCTSAFSQLSPIVAVRGFADDFANPWITVS